MAFIDDEQSKHDGRPVELFKYEGTYDNYFYTSGPEQITYLGDDYIPIATKRSALNVQTQNEDSSEVTIELPVSSQLIAVYGFQIAPPDLKLTIYRGHNGDYVRAWSGNVENIQVAKGTASVRVPSDLAAALNADLPNVYYQGPCNHALFDARCGVSYAAWSFETEVVLAASKVITLAGIGTLDGKLIGGDAVLASGERRMIVTQIGNVITVNYPFAQIAPTDIITIAAGCDLAWAGDCDTRFNNQERFGGFPFIPPKNIFSTGLEPGKDVADLSCAPTSGNLGFELGNLSFWVGSVEAEAITGPTGGGILPHSGSYFLYFGTVGSGFAYQTLFVPSNLFSQVDSNLIKLSNFSAWHVKFDEQTDHGRLFVEFRNQSNGLISRVNGAYNYSNVWQLVNFPITDVPPLTRRIRFGCEGVRDEGASCDSYWDDFTKPILGL